MEVAPPYMLLILLTLSILFILLTLFHFWHCWHCLHCDVANVQQARVTLIVLACQPGWEEMENMRENNSEWSQPGRKAHNQSHLLKILNTRFYLPQPISLLMRQKQSEQPPREENWPLTGGKSNGDSLNRTHKGNEKLHQRIGATKARLGSTQSVFMNQIGFSNELWGEVFDFCSVPGLSSLSFFYLKTVQIHLNGNTVSIIVNKCNRRREFINWTI